MTNFFVCLLFAVTFALLMVGHHRGSPVRVWIAMWTIAWAINAAIGGVFYFSSDVVLIIVIGVQSYVFGAVLFWNTISLRPIPPAGHMQAFTHHLQHATWLTTLLVIMLASILVLLEMGLRKLSGSSLVSFLFGGRSQMFAVMKANQAALYLNNGFNFPSEFKLITLILTFVPVFVCFRMSFANRVRSDYITLLALIILSILFSAVGSVRSLLLVPLVVGFFSFYVGCILNDRTHILRRKRTIFGVIALVCGFGFWVIIVQSARMGDLQFERVGATLEHMRPWFAGYVPALSVWFENFYPYTDHTWGMSFFRAIFGPLGLVSGEGFSDRIDAVGIGNWQTSNAMTIFRIFLQDFGPLGTSIFCILLGFFGELSYYRARRSGGVWIVFLIVVYCSVFFSINFWFFFYGARVFGMILALFVMIIITIQARRTYRRQQRHMRLELNNSGTI
ncbi:O-antigen polymerase [Pseudophaeobacter sp.]|uniref:O-antigen polymerase n=1 Tax=Pseudophaeobacter sp. TaxID=1971739 RepID=UPI0032988A10